MTEELLKKGFEEKYEMLKNIPDEMNADIKWRLLSMISLTNATNYLDALNYAIIAIDFINSKGMITEAMDNISEFALTVCSFSEKEDKLINKYLMEPDKYREEQWNEIKKTNEADEEITNISPEVL